MVEGVQYREGISALRWRVFSTDVSHHQYGEGTSSVQWSVVQHRTTKTDHIQG